MKVTAVINRIPFRLLPYPLLFKFDYCHYLYSSGAVSGTKGRFSAIELPPVINDWHEQAAACLSQVSPVTCIVDNALFTDVIKKIRFYRRLGFLSSEDLQVLQAELFELLTVYENLLRNRTNSSGCDYVFYYSMRCKNTVLIRKYETQR